MKVQLAFRTAFSIHVVIAEVLLYIDPFSGISKFINFFI